MIETIKWMLYRKWNKSLRSTTTPFTCPHCRKSIVLPYDVETGNCSLCKKKLYLTDWFEFHDLFPTSKDVPNTYMSLHIILLLFDVIHRLWEGENWDVLDNSLSIKDGGFGIRFPETCYLLRNFIQYAHDHGHDIHMIGQEKDGDAHRNLKFLVSTKPGLKMAPPPGDNASFFIRSSNYILEQIMEKRITGKDQAYGRKNTFGSKVFVKNDDYHSIVISIPTGRFKKYPKYKDLIGAPRIFATLPYLITNRYYGALFPIVEAHELASISNSSIRMLNRQ